MFTLGINELLIICFVIILVITPADLPKVMKSLGKSLARLRLFTRSVNNHFNDFIDNALLSNEVEDEENEK